MPQWNTNLLTSRRWEVRTCVRQFLFYKKNPMKAVKKIFTAKNLKSCAKIHRIQRLKMRTLCGKNFFNANLPLSFTKPGPGLTGVRTSYLLHAFNFLLNCANCHINVKRWEQMRWIFVSNSVNFAVNICKKCSELFSPHSLLSLHFLHPQSTFFCEFFVRNALNAVNYCKKCDDCVECGKKIYQRISPHFLQKFTAKVTSFLTKSHPKTSTRDVRNAVKAVKKIIRRISCKNSPRNSPYFLKKIHRICFQRLLNLI